MEMKRITKNGRTVEYGIDGDHVLIRDPETGQQLARIPVSGGEGAGDMQTEKWGDFINCMKGCYPLKAGDPILFAACCAECATLMG